jgi:predicted Zn-dependent protease
MSRLEIFAYLKNECKYSEPQCYKYMQEAREEGDRRAIQNYGEDIKEDIERWEQLFSKANKDGDKKMASDALKEICKIKGHYVERVDITSKGKEITAITLNRINSKDKDTE